MFGSILSQTVTFLGGQSRAAMPEESVVLAESLASDSLHAMLGEKFQEMKDTFKNEMMQWMA